MPVLGAAHNASEELGRLRELKTGRHDRAGAIENAKRKKSRLFRERILCRKRMKLK
jgi:hypothetical protein